MLAIFAAIWAAADLYTRAARQADRLAPGRAPVIEGWATARDGDSLMFGRVEVRLGGLDAPERDQPGGTEATAMLAALIGAGPVRCDVLDRGRWGRPIVRCTAGALDLARAMVRRGFAAVHPDYEQTYARDQAAARRAGAGLWGGGIIPGGWRCGPSDRSECPWRWRDAKRQESEDR